MAGSRTLRSAAALLLLACVLQATAAMPMHPDLLAFARLPMSGVSLEQELEQTAARTLQQQPNNGNLFQEGGGPFTFDGFGFGYGGVLPGGGFFDGFGLNIYNIIFRDILNEGLNQYLANGLANSVQPFDFIPPRIGNFFNRDVAVLFGFDAVDKFVGQYLKRASASVGKLVDAGCVGPTYSITVKGGECEIADDGSVSCTEPTIEASSTPYICNLPYRGAAKLEGQSYKYKVQFGEERKGELSLAAGEYNFGAAVNVTTPYLGVNLQTARLANDFGVQQWYQFVGNLILNELLRIQAALLSGAADSKILTTQANRPRSGIADGVVAVADAGNELLDKIAQTMGINTTDLAAGLNAAGVLPASMQPRAGGAGAAAAQQQRRQQAAPPADGAMRTNGITPNVAAPDEGGQVVVKSTNVQEGDPALLNSKEPLVKKAEGAMP